VPPRGSGRLTHRWCDACGLPPIAWSWRAASVSKKSKRVRIASSRRLVAAIGLLLVSEPAAPAILRHA